MAALSSYVAGKWHTPTEAGAPIYDASTGEQVASASSAGIDFGAVVAHARTLGGPALRALTFQQRAAALRALGDYLRANREDLYTVSAQTGATLGDSKFDIDGGIGVLLSYASKGRKELPDDVILVDGGIDTLGRSGQFVAQHILTTRPGVAVQINAFNFPVWGPLEKFAPAFLAGVPSIIKPATGTAQLTARLVEHMVASGALPEGSVQLICGGIGDLFDHLNEQDSVAFTGSAATALKLRMHPAINAQAVRFNAEADSVNCSILGPDATPDTPAFAAYVKQLAQEMTVKAGQKCTAIRRAFVPESLVGAVAEAASAALAKVSVGDPRDPAVRMGALASLAQREEVRRSVGLLLNSCDLAFGDTNVVALHRATAAGDTGSAVSTDGGAASPAASAGARTSAAAGSPGAIADGSGPAVVTTPEEVQASAGAGGVASPVAAGGTRLETPTGVNAKAGAFVSPMLLVARPGAQEPHEVEAFGPVSTIIGYRDVADLVALAAKGKGSLAGSLVTEDAAFARSVVLAMAPWHGRILVLDAAAAAESTGHGSPMPTLIHGGPGRAGGGEEMGGLRAVHHHMQRTAIQGSPAMLGALTGQWVAGAKRQADGIHPFRKSLAELRVGDAIVAGPRTVTAEDVAHFAEFTGDTFYAHTDPVAAAANPFFNGIVAHGYLVLSLAAGLFVQPDPGPVLANYGLENLRFVTPTYPGDDLTVTLTCKEIIPRLGGVHGEVRWDAVVANQAGAPVATYDVLTLVAKEWPQ
jgi:oxepin-CoA hydrolase / 3-oxo-5,6-dehydrosuberyl-CoA semialdehyde dehydrogenase